MSKPLTVDERVEDERELLGLWLSRLMFNPFVGFEPETRSFEEFVETHRERRPA